MTGPRVLIADDHNMLLGAFEKLLSSECEIVGTASDGRTLVAEAQRLKPDVVVLDIAMPGLSGLDLLPSLRQRSPSTKVVMLTHHEGASFVEQAFQGGAVGYLSKDSDPSEFARAIVAVHRGDPYVSPRVASGFARRSRENGEGRAPTRLALLTAREREVFQLLALGKSNKEIARLLRISLGTTKKHRENLQRKVGCGSAAELARLAIREGLQDA